MRVCECLIGPSFETWLVEPPVDLGQHLLLELKFLTLFTPLQDVKLQSAPEFTTDSAQSVPANFVILLTTFCDPFLPQFADLASPLCKHKVDHFCLQLYSRFFDIHSRQSDVVPQYFPDVPKHSSISVNLWLTSSSWTQRHSGFWLRAPPLPFIVQRCISKHRPSSLSCSAEAVSLGDVWQLSACIGF